MLNENIRSDIRSAIRSLSEKQKLPKSTQAAFGIWALSIWDMVHNGPWLTKSGTKFVTKSGTKFAPFGTPRDGGMRSAIQGQMIKT